MIEQYLQIFYATCEAMIPLIIPVFCVYLVLNLIGSLFFDR